MCSNEPVCCQSHTKHRNLTVSHRFEIETSVRQASNGNEGFESLLSAHDSRCLPPLVMTLAS